MPRLAATLILISVFFLVAAGLVMLASTSAWANGLEQPQLLLTKQVGIMLAASVTGVILHFIHPEMLRKMTPMLFYLGVFLLMLCYVPGVSVSVNGASRWVKFPAIPQFQPSEIGKIVALMALAAYYAKNAHAIRTWWKGIVLPGVIFAVPVFLIFFEKDMDTAMALSVSGLALMVCVGAKMRFILPIVISAAVLGSTVIMKDETRRKRIDAWMQLEENPKELQDINRQQYRSLLAFGNGGPEGVGLGNGVEKHGYLPEAHTDFIFPVIGEELGLYFTLGILFCYVLFGVGGFLISMNTPEIYGRALAIGLTMMILLPAFINIGVTIGFLPNAGLPLPFVSYGGTSLLFSIWSVALLLGINRHNKIIAMKESEGYIPQPTVMRL
jgi:cell division protein FtsW